MATTTAWTAAWVTSRVPWSSSSAADIARVTINAICRPPMPSHWVSMSPTKTPTATPMVTSPTRRSRWPYDVPRLTTAATGAKNGRTWWKTSKATYHAIAAAIAHCPTCHFFELSRASRCRIEVRPRATASSTCGAPALTQCAPA